MLKLIKNAHGDTIIEVLVALAVLSLAFALSYGTASRALADTQNSQEHTLALEYLDAQFEALRYYAGHPGVVLPTNSFFLDLTTGSVQVKPAPGTEPGSGFSYSITLALDTSQTSTYHATITWPGLGNLGPQSEELSYRVY